jgi:hypothetical protein
MSSALPLEDGTCATRLMVELAKHIQPTPYVTVFPRLGQDIAE